MKLPQNNIYARARIPLKESNTGGNAGLLISGARGNKNISSDRAEEFTLTLRAEPSNVPAMIRMRKALKALLRTYAFRCTGIITVTPNPEREEPS